jgi:GNAT superfamily N-acetyltransferase
MSVRILSEVDAPVVTEILCEAFYDYPVMGWVLADSGTEYDRLLSRMIGYFVAARVFRGEPLLGVDHDGGLGAAAILSSSDGPPSPPEMAVERDAVWRDLGPQALARYEAFGDAFEKLLVSGSHLHLNMIGTRSECRGMGYGGLIMEYVHSMSEKDPASRGVSLTTEDPSNVLFYERYGYEITGHARVSPEVETWVFFRPDSP